ncbi:MAG: L-fucose:H+ symporter permease [Bacteroidales bacterium]|nr:L-fucose:H+ symporter permease [Bacteroidales bacterium]MDD4361453.1 L-fucose:H+ symporter permease [Bacteroidales bacterium]MDD4430541.1 L-fucose:H+ symporter permease [Bacteroidales bacterium]
MTKTQVKVVTRQFLLPFVLVTSLFYFWGIANNMTDTLLSAFKRIMSMTDVQTSLIQLSFYGSYFCFALPAALFIKRYSYKSGVLLGLFLYAAGAMLFYPAAQTASYGFYLFAIYVLAGGCSILETTANPYILSMGSPETATRRLNLAQAFNPLGSITGILLSQYFILAELNSADATQRLQMDAGQLKLMQAGELNAVTYTYMGVGFVLFVILLIMIFSRMPKSFDNQKSIQLGSTFKRLIKNKLYSWGVVAQFFYVGAQIGVWSFTIRIVMQELGINEQSAASVYLLSIICFSVSRFIFTWLMRYIRPSRLLIIAAVADIVCTAAVILAGGSGMFLIVMLIGVSVFMSLMFPTIYGIALDGLGEDAKIGASGLIMAILGGALLTPLQGQISDLAGINLAYIVPLLCFVVVLAYGMMAQKAGK